MKTHLPLFYHPSSVLFLDDSQNMLTSLSMKVDKDFSPVLQQNPQEALKYLKSHHLDPTNQSAFVIKENEEVCPDAENSHVETYDIDFSSLHDDLISPQRFQKVQVAVIDRHIPAMDGLEFCRLIKKEFKFSIKIILLTGATTIDQAVEAFNCGLIDAFIQKSSSSDKMMIEINKKINELAWQQFQENSQQLTGLFNHKLSHNANPNFCELFKKIREENGIVEFYLYDSSGSFLMLNKQGESTLLLLRSKADFEMMDELADDSGASNKVLAGLRNQSLFPFSSANNPLLLEGKEWDKVMVEMHPVPNQDLFYAIVPFTDIKAVSFERYINEMMR